MFRSILLSALALGLAFAASPAQAQSLRGSRSSVERMYAQALRSDLHFYETGSGVRRAAREGTLVRLSGNSNYRVGNVTYAYALPATRSFVQSLAARYRDRCGEKLVVTSGVRPRSMRLSNSVSKSVHPTGMAVDLRKPRDGRCLAWLRTTLQEMERDGRIEATEEHRPPHFHVAVLSARRNDVQLAASAGKPESSSGAKGSSDSAGRSASRKSSSRLARAEAGARTHKVRRGESIWTIARRNRVSVERIKSANNLRSSRILAGQLLVIPSGE